MPLFPQERCCRALLPDSGQLKGYMSLGWCHVASPQATSGIVGDSGPGQQGSVVVDQGYIVVVAGPASD